jgi:hypothetical protein
MDSPKPGDTIKFRTKSKKREWRIGRIQQSSTVQHAGDTYIAVKVQDIRSSRYHIIPLPLGLWAGETWDYATPVEIAKYKCTGESEGSPKWKVFREKQFEWMDSLGKAGFNRPKVRVNP